MPWLVTAVTAVMAIGSASCATVRPYERGHLASPAMNPHLGHPETTDQYRAKLLESRTATGLPGSSPGGGCGCSQ